MKAMLIGLGINRNGCIPSSLQARMIRSAISPRFAMRIFEHFRVDRLEKVVRHIQRVAHFPQE